MKLNMGEYFVDIPDEELIGEFAGRIAERTASERGIQGSELNEIVENARKGEPVPIRVLRRTRHLLNGAIVGSKQFVRETAALFHDKERVERRKLTHGTTVDGESLYCFKPLRRTR